jgi:hypothetical protein
VLTGLNLGKPIALRGRGRFGWSAAVGRIADEVEQLASERAAQ